MAVVGLRSAAEVLDALALGEQADGARGLAAELHDAVRRHGIVQHPRHGQVFAYEVDGFGSFYCMDDPNVPSLLSLPYLGYCRADDLVYQRTRALVLSEDNPWFARGTVASGITSPHTGVLHRFWPMATIVQALTSSDDAEIVDCLGVIRRTHGDTWFIHEGVNVDDPSEYTRPWFAWANSLFGELILHLQNTRPNVLQETYRDRPHH